MGGCDGEAANELATTMSRVMEPRVLTPTSRARTGAVKLDGEDAGADGQRIEVLADEASRPVGGHAHGHDAQEAPGVGVRPILFQACTARTRAGTDTAHVRRVWAMRHESERAVPETAS